MPPGSAAAAMLSASPKPRDTRLDPPTGMIARSRDAVASDADAPAGGEIACCPSGPTTTPLSVAC